MEAYAVRNVAKLGCQQHEHPAILEADVAGLVKDAVHRPVETAQRRLVAGGEGCHVHARTSPARQSAAPAASLGWTWPSTRTASRESETQPKIPPCALIISRPTRWNSGK